MSALGANMDKQATNKSTFHSSHLHNGDSGLIRCPDCNSERVVFDSTRGEVCCLNCGLVIEDNYIETTQDWRAYTKEQIAKRARTGAPKNLLQYDPYGTVIDSSNRDIFGNNLSPEQISQMIRLRNLQKRVGNQFGSEKNLLRALNELKRISSQLSVTQKISETAAIIYKKILKNGLVRGRATEALVSAALYMSCRLDKHPITLDEIADKTNLTKKKLAKNFRFLLKHLEIKTPISSPDDKLAKYASLLGFSQQVVNDAQMILIQAKKSKITIGKNPNSLAAAALYIAALRNGKTTSQKEIASVCQVTEVTLRNRYKQFIKELKLNLHLTQND